MVIQIEEARRTRRMAEDRAKILNQASWPLHTLHLKTQPWIERWEGGYIFPFDILAVHIKGGPQREIRHYPSVEKMVEYWSVD